MQELSTVWLFLLLFFFYVVFLFSMHAVLFLPWLGSCVNALPHHDLSPIQECRVASLGVLRVMLAVAPAAVVDFGGEASSHLCLLVSVPCCTSGLKVLAPNTTR